MKMFLNQQIILPILFSSENGIFVLLSHTLCFLKISLKMIHFQNIPRLIRALFEIFLRLNNAIMAKLVLRFALMFEQQQWDHETPLRQFQRLSFDVLDKIERHDVKIHRIRELGLNEVGSIIRNQREASQVKYLADCFPYVEIETKIMPITRSVLRIIIDIKADFKWDTKIHGYAQSFWLWIEDPDHNIIYHHEYFQLTRKLVSLFMFRIKIPLKDHHNSKHFIFSLLSSKEGENLSVLTRIMKISKVSA